MPEMQTEEVVTWLAERTDKQFVELFYAFVAGRDIYGAVPGFESHLVLANAAREKEESGAWGPWELEVVGTPSSSEPWVDDALICQDGHCCSGAVTSWAKDMTCPVCGAEVHGT